MAVPGGQRQMRHGGGERFRANRVRLVCEVLRVDDVFATVVVLCANGVVLQGSGFAHGWGFRSEMPVYLHKAAALRAKRVLREWMRAIDQSLLHSVVIYAGNALASNQITE